MVSAAVRWRTPGLRFVGATLLALCAICLSARSQTGAGVPKDATDLTPNQKAILDKLRASPEASNTRVYKILDVAAALLTGDHARLLVPISGGSDVVLVRTQPSVRAEDGAITWRGEVEGTGENAVLMLWNNGQLSGYFGYQGRIFTIKPLAGDLHVIAEIDRSKLPPLHAPTKRRPGRSSNQPMTLGQALPDIAPFSDAERQALEAKKITISLMILYTPHVAAHYIGDLAKWLAFAIEEVNTTFRNSGLGNISVILVHSQVIEYDEAGADHFDNLYRMVDGLDPFADLKQLRHDKGADIVGLMLDSPSGCGLSTRVGADAEDAFFVIHHACAVVTLTIAHEIGHILGARHDYAIDESDFPFPYAHGYVNGTKWRTIMSYNADCGGCPRIPYWSNPRITYKGEPTGTIAADNARLILEQAERVSKFKYTKPFQPPAAYE
jgi:metallopeptidase family M12-like protein